MNKYRKQMAEQFLSQALGIICLLTGEEYAIVKKRPSHSSIQKMRGEVPIKCDDVAVYFSMEEWDYIDGHKELYKDVMMETHQALRTMEIPGNESTESTGHSDEDLNTAAIREQNLQAVKTPLEISAGDINADVADQTDLRVTCQLEQQMCDSDSAGDINADVADQTDLRVTCQSPEQQMCDSDSAGDFKTEVTLNAEQTNDLYLTSHLEAVKQEIGDNISTDEDIADIVKVEITEDLCVRGQLGASDEESSDSISLGDVKTGVTLNAKQTTDLSVESHRLAVKQEISENISTGRSTNYNKPSQDKTADASFNLLQNQRSHVGNVCYECGKCFTSKTKLTEHQKIHTGDKPFSCSECAKCFNSKTKLGRHQKIHTGEKAFSCYDCGKCFSEKSDLIRHQKFHTGEKAFSCSECGKCFILKSDLIRHLKVHTQEKAFSCSECGNCFTRKSSLIRHQKTHTGEKAFLCSKCGKCFAQKSTLIIHQKIHTGVKEFSCFKCGKCFTQKSTLLTHQKIHIKGTVKS
ncbi:oocyte zinc finger protein XlCOF7.1-like isoform X3 [Bombina bombina]|uniref:oocyte zinc finger protein XlCOF7.1-like isoform X3 n=1 Tax=Bombina bombina TaxID=8345 RepID=UPI00235A9562|nr:oocyte zinc finger protein XlCOF7.1-like isoform X3 [Bombina bombina]